MTDQSTKPVPFIWTEEHKATLHKMWMVDRRPIADIAANFGVTINSVWKACARNGWKRGQETKQKTAVKAVLTGLKDRKAPVVPVLAKSFPPAIKSAFYAPTPPRPVISDAFDAKRAKPWDERRNNVECAYPVGNPSRPAEQLSCCARVLPGKMYCETHHEIMFDTLRSRERIRVPRLA